MKGSVLGSKGNDSKDAPSGISSASAEGYARAMRVARLFLAAILVVPALSPPSYGQTVSSPQQFLDLWGKAWDAHDVDAIMRLHADDCVTVNRFGVVANGKDEIRRGVTWLHNGPFHTAHFSAPKLIDQHKVAPGVIVLQASWKNPSGKADPPEDDLIMTVVLKDFGGEGWFAEEIDTHTVAPITPSAAEASAGK